MNPFIAFLEELFNRFALKSPKFFQILQKVGIVLLAITGIPEALLILKTSVGIDLWTYLPEAVQWFASKTIALAGILLWVLAKLPVQNSTTVMNTSNKLPFTEKQQG